MLRTVAAVGGVAATAGVASAQPYDGWFTSDAMGGADDTYDGSTVDARGEAAVTVEVGADGNGDTFAYAPSAVRIDPGTEVTFEWVSNTHNVVVQEQPDGADWGGHEPIEDSGFSFSHTFETEGVYKYYCEPHLSLGMKGAVVVGDADVGESATADGDRESGGIFGVFPDSPIMLTMLGFLTAAVALVAVGEVLGSYDRGRDRAQTAVEETGGAVVAAPVEEPARELDHESFDPTGTWTLVLLYLLILVVMWVLTYFVEFLGRGPTVIG